MAQEANLLCSGLEALNTVSTQRKQALKVGNKMSAFSKNPWRVYSLNKNGRKDNKKINLHSTKKIKWVSYKSLYLKTSVTGFGLKSITSVQRETSNIKTSVYPEELQNTAFISVNILRNTFIMICIS